MARPHCPIKEAYAERFNLSEKSRRNLSSRLIKQLSLCKSDEARNLILKDRLCAKRSA